MAHLHVTRAAIRVAGTAGFVGLLVVSHYLPAIATALRIAAIVWFFGFGIAFAIFDFKFTVATRLRRDQRHQGGSECGVTGQETRGA
jgi:hypothetical protein